MDKMIYFLVCFMLGYLVHKMNIGNGFSIGGQQNCNLKPGYDKKYASLCAEQQTSDECEIVYVNKGLDCSMENPCTPSDRTCVWNGPANPPKSSIQTSEMEEIEGVWVEGDYVALGLEPQSKFKVIIQPEPRSNSMPPVGAILGNFQTDGAINGSGVVLYGDIPGPHSPTWPRRLNQVNFFRRDGGEYKGLLYLAGSRGNSGKRRKHTQIQWIAESNDPTDSATGSINYWTRISKSTGS